MGLRTNRLPARNGSEIYSLPFACYIPQEIILKLKSWSAKQTLSHFGARSVNKKQEFNSIFSQSEKLQQFSIQNSELSIALNERFSLIAS